MQYSIIKRAKVSIGEDVGKLEPLYTVGRNKKNRTTE